MVMASEDNSQRVTRNLSKLVEGKLSRRVEMFELSSRGTERPVLPTPTGHAQSSNTDIAPGPQKGKNGPSSLKHKCFSCNQSKWVIDYSEGKSADLSRVSVCQFCKLSKADTMILAEQRCQAAQLKSLEVTVKQHFESANAQADGLRREFQAKLDALSAPATPNFQPGGSPNVATVDANLVSRIEALERKLSVLTNNFTSASSRVVNNSQCKELSNHVLSIEKRVVAMEKSVESIASAPLPPPPSARRMVPAIPVQDRLGPQPGVQTLGETWTVINGKNRRSGRVGSLKPTQPKPSTPKNPVLGVENRQRYLSKRQKKNRNKAMSKIGVSSRKVLPVQPDTLLIGDSMVANQTTRQFKSLRKENKSLAFPGAKISRITNEISKLKLDRDSTLMVSVGGNDVFLRNGKCGPFKRIMSDFEELMVAVKKKTSRAVILGLLPRVNTWRENDPGSWEQYHAALEINKNLVQVCRRYSLRYLNPWNFFYGRNDFYLHDGVHFSRSGAKAFAGIANSRRFAPIRERVVVEEKGRGPGRLGRNAGTPALEEVNVGIRGLPSDRCSSVAEHRSSTTEPVLNQSGLTLVNTVAEVHASGGANLPPLPSLRQPRNKKRNRDLFEPQTGTPRRNPKRPRNGQSHVEDLVRDTSCITKEQQSVPGSSSNMDVHDVQDLKEQTERDVQEVTQAVPNDLSTHDIVEERGTSRSGESDASDNSDTGGPLLQGNE